MVYIIIHHRVCLSCVVWLGHALYTSLKIHIAIGTPSIPFSIPLLVFTELVTFLMPWEKSEFDRQQQQQFWYTYPHYAITQCPQLQYTLKLDGWDNFTQTKIPWRENQMAIVLHCCCNMMLGILWYLLRNIDSLDPLELFSVLPELRAESRLVDPQSKSHKEIHTWITECLAVAVTSPSLGNRKG